MRVVSHEALRVIQSRVSITKLTKPAPNATELLEVFKAAARAPDHGKLKPWRFLILEGRALELLSHIFLAAVMKLNPAISPAVVEKTKNMPFRAPMIIVSIADCQENSTVPKREQIIACGAATQNLLNALFALNYGAVWRTGDLAYNEHVAQSLGVVDSEEIIGFIYVGTPAVDIPEPPQVDVTSIFSVWPAK